ncbi:hypothetical protein V2A60_006475 [Cordyceps javanica]|uniref:Ankyrin repeat-containing protein n=1 Tax=Cordyceps javanica TaxID=43265 RepID=A0A545V7W7_9HYPO|nr:Ankyrin repeat-containing protein [Cordyceps javanica]TQW09022.1 Ankyrin repeat-containing protein [Cordyceps javanica]
MTPQRLDDLAAELIVDVARHLWLGDMSRLAQANRRLHQVVDPFLYLTDSKPYNQYALFWAAQHNLSTVAERALHAGTPAEPYNTCPSRLRPFGRPLLTTEELEAAARCPTLLTPLDIAAAAGHTEVAALLLRHLPPTSAQCIVTAIRHAASNGHVETADLFLRHTEHSSEQVGYLVRAAFMAAADAGQTAVLERLLETEEGPAAVNQSVSGFSYRRAMMRAAGAGHDEVWDLLLSSQPLELDTSFTVQHALLDEALGMAVTGTGSRAICELVQRYISLGYDWKREGEPERMLQVALMKDNVPLMELLLSYSSEEQRNREILVQSFRSNNCLKVRKMLLHRDIPSSVWEQAFEKALRERRVDEARQLIPAAIDAGEYVLEDGPRMLLHACAMGFLELVELLLWHALDSEARDIFKHAQSMNLGGLGMLQLLMAPGRGNERLAIARILLEAGVDPNKRANVGVEAGSPLSRACIYGLREIAQLLMEHGADVLEVDARGVSLLHTVCTENPDVVLIKELLARGADVMARTAGGATPLHHMCLAGYNRQTAMNSVNRYQAAKLLISHGADPNAGNLAGTTPLHFACGNTPHKMDLEDAKVVLALLESGADIEKPNSGHKTPLFLACSALNHPVASILLAQGADLSSRTLHGFADRLNEVVLDEFIDCHTHEMAKLLLAHGADQAMLRHAMLLPINDRRVGFETLRLLMMHGGATDRDTPLLFQKDDQRSHLRTVVLAEELGMVKDEELANEVDDMSPCVVLAWPRERRKKAPIADEYDGEDDEILYY